MQPKQSGIYAIQNKLNGHQYIGSAVNIARRWDEHRSYLKRGVHHSPILQRAWAKYPEDAFEFVILEIVEDVTQLTFIEQRYLDELKPRYNVSPSAGSNRGIKYRPEVVAAMRLRQTGKRQSPETIAKRIASIKSRPPTPAEIARNQKMSAYLREKNQSTEQRTIVSTTQRGRKYSNRLLTKKQQQALATGRVLGPSASARVSRGRPLNETTKRKLSFSVSAAKAGKPLTEKQITANTARQGRPITEKQQAAYEAKKQRTIARKQDPGYQKKPRVPSEKWLAYLERRKARYAQQNSPSAPPGLWDDDQQTA